MRKISFILDSSALLAHLKGEVGGDFVAKALSAGVGISEVNYIEVVTRLLDDGYSLNRAVSIIDGLMEHFGTVFPLVKTISIRAAELRIPTKSAGLSLADRICIACAEWMSVPVLTADREWGKKSVLSAINTDVILIRGSTQK